MAETKKGRGCLFYGTITFILVVIGVMAGIYFGARKAILTAVSTYTAPSPAPIPQLILPPQEQNRIANELAREARRAIDGQGTNEVILSDEELNILLKESPDLAPYSKQIYLQPEGDKLKAQVSIPLAQFEHWKELGRKLRSDLGNRYLNGTAFLDVSVTNGTLRLSLQDLVVNGQSLPADFTSRIEGQNWADAANKNPDMQAALQRIEDIYVQDGKVHVKFKRETE